MNIIPGAEPFFFEGGLTGCLLIHGFSGTPREMLGLGKSLAAANYTVSAPLIAGHGTSPEDFAKTTWPDWVASVQSALDDLRGKTRQIFLIGLSAGGVIGLHLAATNPVTGLVCMSVPMYFNHPLLRFIPLLKLFVKYHRETSESDLADPSALSEIITYKRRPLSCVESLMKLQEVVRQELKQIKTPTLIMQGDRDRAIPPESADYIYEHLGSSDKTILHFPNSGHGIQVDAQKETVWAEIKRFIEERVNP